MASIAVVGAGAIGCYFGGMLARAGNAVTLIGRKRHVETINRRGLIFESAGRREAIAAAATEDIAAVHGAEVVLFCVKSLDTDRAARDMAPHLPPNAVVVSLQNGVDNVERIRPHTKNWVLPALIYVAAQMPEPGFVRHTGGGSMVIGETAVFGTDRRAAAEVAALFTGAGVQVKVSDDIESELWIKLLMNCAYNAICALSQAPYGAMVAMPEVEAVMREAVAEVQQVASAKGIRLPDDIADATIKLAVVMPTTMSSTAQDLRNGRRTEIDHLNGYVVREGEALGIATPVNRTFDALIKLLERAKGVRD
jgi:2-dehydropantoate 2-reductase